VIGTQDQATRFASNWVACLKASALVAGNWRETPGADFLKIPKGPGAAHEERVVDVGSRKVMEAPVQIDVVRDQDSAGTQNAPRLLKLEASVVFGVDAIV